MIEIFTNFQASDIINIGVIAINVYHRVVSNIARLQYSDLALLCCIRFCKSSIAEWLKDAKGHFVSNFIKILVAINKPIRKGGVGDIVLWLYFYRVCYVGFYLCNTSFSTLVYCESDCLNFNALKALFTKIHDMSNGFFIHHLTSFVKLRSIDKTLGHY